MAKPVVGRVTASSKYVLSASAAADGSQTPAGILSDDIDATGALVVATDDGALTVAAGDVVHVRPA